MLDGKKYQWIGSMNKESSICLTSSYSKTRSLDDLLKFETIVGAIGRKSDNVVFTTFLKNKLGAKLKIIMGYPRTCQAVLAVERKEIEGICGWSW